ncbi:hypothetical protein AcV5_003247 [Taiwanofungus camphoratus]|nr:hypothetical protein AcV5_003247 [Antrodia cinnamomea]KAI0929412.1 hypothetical protein AcV7_005269 [Antrodia cinnamomea]
MLCFKFAFFALVCSALALPIKREVPQEHSHNSILASVRTSLNVNNPDQIQDPVFALLGAAAASQGAGKINDTDCLQQAVADQAFTNAKAAGDVNSMVNALIFRALERNSGSVGATTNQCTSLTAVNPEIAAIQQHQDPASTNAASVNKAIVLELAKQIASVGGNATDALQSGTFAPGQIGDPTARGNSCDDANDTQGCIFTQNLLVDDATVDEINSAVAGVSASVTVSSAVSATVSSTASAAAVTGTSEAAATSSSSDDTATCGTLVTVTVTPSTTASSASVVDIASASATASAVAVTSASAATATSSVSAASGANLQTFTGALDGISAPAVTAGGRGFEVENNDSFLNLAAALGRSCDVQHNQCADAANAGGQSFTVGDCDTQNTQCKAAESSATSSATGAAAASSGAISVSATASAAAVTSSDAASSAAASSAAVTSSAAAATSSAASGQNLQTFTGALGGVSAPAVTAGGRGFEVENNDSFLNLSAALGRSCDVQHNQCADAANSGGQSFTVGDCDTQDTQCKAAAGSS